MKTSDMINELAAALAKAQGAMGLAAKDSANPYFRSRYADLASVVEAFRQPLADSELSLVQPFRIERLWDKPLTTIKQTRKDGESTSNIERQEARVLVIITTRLIHASGQWLEEEAEFSPLMDTPQAIGSCVTYGRRYGAAAMTGVAPGDDDGEAAEGRDTPAGRPQQQQRPSGAAAALRNKLAPSPAEKVQQLGDPAYTPPDKGGQTLRRLSIPQVKRLFTIAGDRADFLRNNYGMQNATGTIIVAKVLKHFGFLQDPPPGVTQVLGYDVVQKSLPLAAYEEVCTMAQIYGEEAVRVEPQPDEHQAG